MKRTLFSIVLAACLIAGLAGCSKDKKVTLVDVSVQVTLPQTEVTEPETAATAAAAYSSSGVTAAGFDVTFTNTISQDKVTVQTDAQGVATARVEEGIYNISVYGVYQSAGGDVIYQSAMNNQTVTAPAQGSPATGVKLPDIKAEVATISGGWVIKEIYAGGCKYTLEEGGKEKSYWADQYITLYNNSDKVLYADSLIIGMSAKYTSGKTEQAYYTSDPVVADMLIQVPGTGKEHPVQPGGCLVVANQGLNHITATNGGSKADMSQADFEWYDDTALDVDVPEVPNMINLYGYSLTINMFSTQSNRSYFILRPTGDINAFMESIKTQVTMPSGTSKQVYAVPASMIIDGVQVANKGALNYLAIPSSVDNGFTYWGETVGASGAWTGKCVTRRVKEKTSAGRYILQDTNNSTNDFSANQDPYPYGVKE